LLRNFGKIDGLDTLLGLGDNKCKYNFGEKILLKHGRPMNNGNGQWPGSQRITLKITAS
jgi:hypothetical protein